MERRDNPAYITGGYNLAQCGASKAKNKTISSMLIYIGIWASSFLALPCYEILSLHREWT